MSAIKLAIHLLLDDAGITGLVGTDVYPVAAPQEKGLPYIAVSLVWEEQETILAGHLDAYTSRVSFACVAASLSAADAIAEAIKDAMSGVVNTNVLDGQGQRMATVTAWKEGTDMTDYTEDRTVFRRLLDYRMRWVR
ncbi:MAG TPA: DUF3168 domain-containing protein [Devosia sp.]|jgi:ribosomal protein S12 methylthiotransferase accessory factor YcaO|nr:DUF3168 domain-containing protein [Devosia sp.]